ncbi:hypothetical protein KKF84_08260, partial [Myxococcota bacterium]|nr:hypothetical protein [Myxococcota bacterium]MBU1535301.1 hypothetical protein [Myxococcota bacterium]
EPLPNWSTSAVEFLSRPFVKEFEGQSAARLLDQYRSSDPILRSLWLSAVNALLNMPARGDPSGTLSHMCGIERTDTVGLVGYFYPVLPELRANCARIHVFDLRDIPGCHPPSMEPVLLPHCDVVVITGTTMLNDTLEGLLPLCSRARTVALVGPSVPLSRELLQSTALTLVAGSVVIDPEPVARGIARGGSARSVKRLLQKRHISQWD